MKVFGIAALGLVAARPQPQFNAMENNFALSESASLDSGLGGGLGALGSEGAPALDDNKQVIPKDEKPNKMPVKKPAAADKNKGEGMKDKHVNKWNEKKDQIHEKYSAAHDKAVAKEDRVEANNAEFAKDHAEKKAHALQKKEEHVAKEDAKKVHAQMKLTEFNTDKTVKQMKHQAHKQKLEAKTEEKKQDHQDKVDDAHKQKEDVEKKTELKKQLAAAAQAKKEATEQAKKDKADFVKWAHYHKILFNCVKKVKHVQKDTFDLNALNKASFADFEGCTEALEGFDWANNFDGFKEKWNAMKEKMEDKMEDMA